MHTTMMVSAAQPITTGLITTAFLQKAPWVEVCSRLAPMLSMALFTAPIPTIRKIHSSRSTLSYPLLPYSSMVANAFLGTTYGYLKKEPKIWSANLFGLLLAVVYVYLYARAAATQDGSTSNPTLPSQQSSIKVHCQGLIAIISLGLYLAWTNRPDAIGGLGVTLCVAMFASPLSTLAQVIRSRSASSIPLPFAAISGINCVLWIVTGYFGMNKDWNVYFPNVCGLAFAVVQIMLKIIYYDTAGETKLGSKTM